MGHAGISPEQKRQRDEWRLAGTAQPCYLVGMEGKSAKESKMIAQERRQRIFEDIETSGIASVRDLAKRFEVSHITIIRDLQELEQEGLIRRVHGGAIRVRGATYGPPLHASDSQYSPE